MVPTSTARAGRLVVLGVVILVVATAMVLFSLLHHSEASTPERASEEFRRLRATWPEPALITTTRRAAQPADGPKATLSLHMIHTVVFDTRGSGRLVRTEYLYFLARLFARNEGVRGFSSLGALTFMDDTEFDSEEISLPTSAIEQHGPGLLIDFEHPSGGQYLCWVN